MARVVAVMLARPVGSEVAQRAPLGQAGDFDQAIGLSRPSVDLCDEANIARVASIETD